MIALGILPPVLMMLGCFAYVFWSQVQIQQQHDRTRAEYLRERQNVVYENLRDLNFEYRAGKYVAEDYSEQRDAMEAEAGKLLTEIQHLEAPAGETLRG